MAPLSIVKILHKSSLVIFSLILILLLTSFLFDTSDDSSNNCVCMRACFCMYLLNEFRFFYLFFGRILLNKSWLMTHADQKIALLYNLIFIFSVWEFASVFYKFFFSHEIVFDAFIKLQGMVASWYCVYI